MERVTHQNRMAINAFVLPPERFGGNGVNLVEVLLKVAKDQLGYVPLMTVSGSMTYMLDEQKKPDWDFVGDMDFQIRVKESLPSDHNLQASPWSIQIGQRFLGALKEKGILIDEEEKRILTIDGKKGFEVHLLISSMNDLGSMPSCAFCRCTRTG